jgi:hypothetical protein
MFGSVVIILKSNENQFPKAETQQVNIPLGRQTSAKSSSSKEREVRQEDKTDKLAELRAKIEKEREV